MSPRQFFSRVLFCMGILFSSIVPSLGMEELPSTEREQAAYTAPADVKDNNVISQVNEEAPYQVPLNINNNNNVSQKDKDEAAEEVNVNDVENEPRVEQPVVLDGYENARYFHARLLREHPDWFGNNVQSYYKRIDPIRSRPAAGINEWRPHRVFIDRTEIMANGQGMYIHDGISFSFDPNFWRNFDPNEDFTISINNNACDNKVPEDVEFMQFSRKKVLALPRLEDYNTCLVRAGGDQFSFMRRITFRGTLDGEEGRSHRITIEAESGQEEAVILRGMELIFNKGAGTTQILLDLIDAAHELDLVGAAREPVDLMPPIEYRHSNEVANNKVFCVKDHQVYNCAGKVVHSFFDFPDTRRRWVPDELNFYDQNNQGLVTLPSSYADLQDRQEEATDPIAWVLGEENSSLYQIQELELQNANNTYMCCDNNSFYALVPYIASCRDYLIPDPTNRVRLNYLLQVKKPSLRINADARPIGGHRPWASGLYKCMLRNNRNYWQHINNPAAHSIDFLNRPTVDILWPAEPLDAQEIIQWGDAAQRFFGTFYAKIRHCNQALADKFNTWGHLNNLELSRVRLANDITWERLFTAIGTMRQLTQFSFTYNHPVANIMEEDSDAGVGRVNPSRYYENLATCIRQLTNLRKLDIQGLWLKNHAQLGSGCQDENSVSIEGARLIGINSRSRQGIRSLIYGICSLAQLESLSIDGFSSKGSSEWARCTTQQKAIVSALFPVTIPLLYGSTKYEDEECKLLVRFSADDLAQMPSLRTISVYSPGGNCINRFSQVFREKLAVARVAAQAARVAARAARVAADARAAERAAARAADQAARAARPNLHAGWGRMSNLFISAIIDTVDIVANAAVPAAQPDLPPLIVNAEVL